jgi:hypothetical protein
MIYATTDSPLTVRALRRAETARHRASAAQSRQAVASATTHPTDSRTDPTFDIRRLRRTIATAALLLGTALGTSVLF